MASTGTLIFDGAIGAKCLKKIAATNVESIDRSDFIGHYSLLVKNGDQLSICSDPQGGYEIYYVATDEYWFVSNSLMLVARAIEDLDVNTLNLLENAFYIKNIGVDTFYDDVKQLYGSQQIRVDLDAETLQVTELERPNPDWGYEDASIETILSDYTDRVREVFGQITEATRDVGLQATGGLDSRTILAGLLDQSTSPRLLYGVGNSGLTNTKMEDLRAVRGFAEEFDLNFRQLNWDSECPHSEDTLSTLFDKYGFRMAIYGASPYFFQEFESGLEDHPMLVMSGYSPAFTNLAPWEMESDYHSEFENFVDHSLTGNYRDFSDGGLPCKEEYIQNIIGNAKQLVEIDHPDALEVDDGLTFDEFVSLKLSFKRRGENINLNIMNEFHYHLCPFYTFHLNNPLADVPHTHREGDKFRVKLLKMLYPSVLNVPLFTGTRPAKIDEETDEVNENVSVHRYSSLSRQLIKIGAQMPERIKTVVKPVYQQVKHSDVIDNPDDQPDCNIQLREYYLDNFNQDPVIDEYVDMRCLREIYGQLAVCAFSSMA